MVGALPRPYAYPLVNIICSPCKAHLLQRNPVRHASVTHPYATCVFERPTALPYNHWDQSAPKKSFGQQRASGAADTKRFSEKNGRNERKMG